MAAAHRPLLFSLDDKLQVVIRVRELMNNGDCRTVAQACKAIGIGVSRYDYFARECRIAGYELPQICKQPRSASDWVLPAKRGTSTDAAFILDDGKTHRPKATVRSESGVPIGWFDSVEEADSLAFDKHWMRVEVAG